MPALAGRMLHIVRYYILDPPEDGMRKSGKWRARYNTGEVTAGMSYGTACDYASIFGGTVERVPNKGKP